MARSIPQKPKQAIVLSARALRRNATQAEQLLWQVLRDRQLDGLKFRRQHALGPYILDFYCASLALAIEIDGSIHEALDQQQHDQQRTQYLEDLGISVLRFTNHQVENDIGSVVQAIRTWHNQHR